MAVDSGTSDRIKAWLVPAGVYGRFREGGMVRATVGPWLGHVFRVEPVGEGRAAGAAPAPGPAPEVLAAGAQVAGP
jgi:hypothetical protein